MIRKTISLLKENNLTVSVAESCTGGYASYLLTKTPGSSKVFKGGIVVYSLEAKNKLVNIPYRFLKNTEGVSEKVATLLSENIRKAIKADVGASVVGFAGPRARKGMKKGTIFLSVSYKNKTFAKRMLIEADRNTVQRKAAHYLIEMIYRSIKVKLQETSA